MTIDEAKQYVDIVVEGLVRMGLMTEDRYGNMTEDQRIKLAEEVAEKSEE